MITTKLVVQTIAALLVFMVVTLFVASWLYITVDRFLQTIPMFAN